MTCRVEELCDPEDEDETGAPAGESGVDEGEFTVNVTAREGTSFPAIDEAMRRVEQDLLKMPEVKTVYSKAGTASLAAAFTIRRTAGSFFVVFASFISARASSGPAFSWASREFEDHLGSSE